MEYLVVSDDRTFMISAHSGDIQANKDGLGLYYLDTRHLSELDLRIEGQAPDLLGFSDEHVYQAQMLLGNAAFTSTAGTSIGSHTIGIRRERVAAGTIFERIVLTNYNRQAVDFDLTIGFAADFVDLFLVRGFPPMERGELQRPQQRDAELILAYHGKDNVVRSTTITWNQPPSKIDTPQSIPAETARPQAPEPVRATMTWHIELAAHADFSLDLTFKPASGAAEATTSTLKPTIDEARALVQASYERWAAEALQVRSNNPAFDELIARSALDLRALVGIYPTGKVMQAGIPWYEVPFGRDSLISSLQTLCFQPDLAVGTLRFLAAYQGTKDDPWRDESPGKIMHELRFGEFAGMGVIPHTPYYGTIDATLLFIMLFAQTIRWTGDRALFQELLPAVHRALAWIDDYGDLDGDGYIEFQPRSENGLRIQGWKDSFDSVLYPDGTLADLPVALVEVQAYAYAAKSWVAALLRQMGNEAEAAQLEQAAAHLKEQFNRDFWLPDIGFYTQALDGHKRPIADLTSNPGHALIGGIVPHERAIQMAERLTGPELASGWGIRTRAATDPNYNPMSYHNGSIWPHDNSLIIYGLHQSGCRDAGNEIAGQIMDAAKHFPRTRLPELMCGFGRDMAASERPAEYPVSCSPQAWAAGTSFMMLQSFLGLEADALDNTLRIAPHLPSWLEMIEIKNLRVGTGRVHLIATHDGVEVISSDGVQVRTT